MKVLKKVQKLRTRHTQLALSPCKERIAIWTENTRRFVVYSPIKREVTDRIKFKYKIAHISWCFSTGNLVITSSKRVFLYNVQKKKHRTLMFADNIAECYRVHSKLLAVLGSQVIVTNNENVAKIRLHCDFFRAIDVFFVVVFENSVTVFDRSLVIVYDHIFENSLKIRDVDVRNRKVFVLTQSSIFGHDLNLSTSCGTTGFRILSEFLFLTEKGQLVAYDRGMSSEMLRMPARRCWIDRESGRVYVLKEGEIIIYALRARKKLKFKLIEKSEFYYEQEDEFDTSDSLHTDF